MERYEAYKDSGVEWIGEIPEGWELRRLKLLGSTRSGMGNKKPDDFGTGRPFLSYKDVYSRESFTSATGLVESLSDDIERYSVLRGDAFFTGSSETIEELGFSSVCLATIPKATFNGFTIRFRPHGGDLYPEFAAYLFRSDVFRGYLRQRDNSITRANLSQQVLGDALAILPTMDEQKRIADYLDAKTAEIDALVADCEREVELLQEYRKAVISEAVTKGLDPAAPMKDSGVEWIGDIPNGWDIVPLRRCIVRTGNGITRRGDYDENGTLVLKLRNINNGAIDYGFQNRMQLSEQELRLFELSVGDFLFVRVNGSRDLVGKSAIFEGFPGSVAYNDHIIRITFSNHYCIPRFILWYLQSEASRREIDLRVKTSAGQFTVSSDDIKECLFVMPPLQEQFDIVSFLDAKTAGIDSLIDAKQHMADKLREYRRSLISEAVTGKFKVPGVK